LESRLGQHFHLTQPLILGSSEGLTNGIVLSIIDKGKKYDGFLLHGFFALFNYKAKVKKMLKKGISGHNFLLFSSPKPSFIPFIPFNDFQRSLTGLLKASNSLQHTICQGLQRKPE